MLEKRLLSDLAICGGPPAFAETLHVGRPNIPSRDRLDSLFGEILDRGWLSNNGPCVQRFEALLAERMAVKHVILTCNATVALELVLRGLDLTGEILVPAFTFVATAHAAQWVGLRPVFVDIDPVTHGMDLADAARKITSATRAIMPVHLWGIPANPRGFEDLARRNGLKLIFDSAHAFGCTHQGVPVGNFGDAEVFSFHATKVLNTLEGGAITTNDDDFAKRLRLMKNFGFAGYDQVIHLGINGKMNEFSAAMGIASIAEFDGFVAHNRSNLAHYARTVGTLPGFRMLPTDGDGERNDQYAVFEVDPGLAGLHRDDFVQLLHREQCIARRYFYPGVHRMAPYVSRGDIGPLPHTEVACDRVLVLPNGLAVDGERIDVIASILRIAVEGGDEVKERLLTSY